MTSTGLLIVWFVVIVALIPVSLWLLKRSGMANGLLGLKQSLIKPVGNLNLGPGQRIVTVEVGEGESRTWLVLGVTSHQINTLHTMAPLPQTEGAQDMPRPEGAAFAKLLRGKLKISQEPH